MMKIDVAKKSFELRIIDPHVFFDNVYCEPNVMAESKSQNWSH